MQDQRQFNSIKPSLKEVFLYSLLTFAFIFVIQMTIHYQSLKKFSDLQCASLIQQASLDLTYKNKSGIEKLFYEIEGHWLHDWSLVDVSQNYSIQGVNKNANTNPLPKIITECSQQKSQYVKLSLQSTGTPQLKQWLVILLISAITALMVMAYLLKVRKKHLHIQTSVANLFHEIALHRNVSASDVANTRMSISEQIQSQRLSLLNYLDNVQHRLQRVDEEFTNQLIQHNQELEERYAYLEIQTRELKNLTEKKSSFFANLSHDFRTPLYTIEGYTRLLEDTTLKSKQLEYTHAIKSANRNLSELVTNFLSMSRLEAGRMNIELSNLDLEKALAEILDGIAFLTTKNNNTVFIDISENLPKELSLDSNKLRQILTNIITNAAKYTQNGVIYIHCDCVSIDANSVSLSISIADTGKGISDKELETIFDPYTRLERDRTTIPGTGLGLGICKELARVIDAELDVSSSVNKGTTFSLTLSANAVVGQQKQVSQNNVLSDIKLFTTSNKVNLYAQQYFTNRGIKHTSFRIADLSDVISTIQSNEHIVLIVQQNDIKHLLQLKDYKALGKQIIISTCMHSRNKEIEEILKPFGRLSNLISQKEFNKNLNPYADNGKTALTPLLKNTLQDYKILLAEDNDLNRFIIEDTLKKYGAKVISCADGAAAINLYSAENYSAILLDAHMPKLSGTEVTKKIRNDFHDQTTAIIGITASTSSTEYQHFIQSGMSDCLIKPLDDDELVNTIIQLGTIEKDLTLKEHRSQSKKSTLSEQQSISADELSDTDPNIKIKLDDRLKTLLLHALDKHTQNLQKLIEQESVSHKVLFSEIHKLNGSLSIAQYNKERQMCQDIEDQLRDSLNQTPDSKEKLSMNTQALLRSVGQLIEAIQQIE